MSDKIPKKVQRWMEIFQGEGETEKAAMRHAIDRTYDAGEISESTADRLDDICRAMQTN